MPAPSGKQWQIAHGDERATVVEVGGGIREYLSSERAVLEPYPLEAMCDGAHGMPLIPWPNRLAGGRYSFEGAEHQLALSEPERANAIHGLLRWRSWECVEQGPDRVVVGTLLHPLPGYPFALEVRIAYSLGEDGLTVSTTAVNVGQSACPYGAGQHPYLSPGPGTLDTCVLKLPASTRILVDDRRKLPTGSEPVEGTPLDFRGGRALGAQRIDSAFTDLSRESSGRALASLSRPDGVTLELWVDRGYDFLEVYTGDDLAPQRKRRGLAIEPMTCAPNAFQSGEGLVRLEPGEAITTRWGVRAGQS